MKWMASALALTLICCSANSNEADTSNSVHENEAVLSSDSNRNNTIQTRFECPDSFFRNNLDSHSFAHYLRNLNLKAPGEKVKYFDGSLKNSNHVYAAVVDMDIGNKDLQQCADAVMRLRAEYLFHQKNYHQISFRFLGDGKMHSYKEYAKSDTSYKKFRKYMEYVFSYANTASLHKQLKPKPLDEMDLGDVFIQTGNPYGHAVIVVDMCQDKQGNKKFMLAQSYMPAQETQILWNPLKKNSVWYDLKSGTIQTPEWTFQSTDLRTWP